MPGKSALQVDSYTSMDSRATREMAGSDALGVNTSLTGTYQVTYDVSDGNSDR